jgi:hypothetical protein
LCVCAHMWPYLIVGISAAPTLAAVVVVVDAVVALVLLLTSVTRGRRRGSSGTPVAFKHTRGQLVLSALACCLFLCMSWWIELHHLQTPKTARTHPCCSFLQLRWWATRLADVDTVSSRVVLRGSAKPQQERRSSHLTVRGETTTLVTSLHCPSALNSASNE